jgi:hypothetical protein
MPRIAFACLCAVALAVLPACGSGGQQVAGASAASTGSSSSGSSSTASSSADSATGESSSGADTTPPLETSGTESARASQGGQPSLTVASLPIGANADEKCLTISFEGAASEVPAGMRLVVTGIAFKPKVVQFGGSGCAGETPVCRVGLALTESGSDQCLASIKSDAGAAGTQVEVQVAATVDCTGGQVPACVRFKEKIESDANNQGIATFEVSEPDEPETTPTDEAPSPSESQPADSSDSSESSDSGTTTPSSS